MHPCAWCQMRRVEIEGSFCCDACRRAYIADVYRNAGEPVPVAFRFERPEVRR